MRIGDAIDYSQNFSGQEVQITVNFGGVIFECIFERFPVALLVPAHAPDLPDPRA